MKKFDGGTVCMTSGIDNKVSKDSDFALFVGNSLKRHLNGDWGDCDPADAKENDFAIGKHLRIFSVYKKDTDKIWVITEADRSITTILLPSEY